MEIINVAFDGLSWLHLDGEKVVVVLLKLLPRGVLVEEGIANLLEAPERSCCEGVKPVQGQALRLEGNTRHMRQSSWEWITILT